MPQDTMSAKLAALDAISRRILAESENALLARRYAEEVIGDIAEFIRKAGGARTLAPEKRKAWGRQAKRQAALQALPGQEKGGFSMKRDLWGRKPVSEGWRRSRRRG